MVCAWALTNKSTIRRFGGGGVIALADLGLRDVAESPKPRSDHGVILVRNQILPRQRSKKVLPDGHLFHSGRIDIVLPSGLERPGVHVAVELAFTSGQHGPVLLTPQH